MSFRLAVAVILALLAASAAALADLPQDGLGAARLSNVTWLDANWPGELGSMPLGNGDAAGNVWVDAQTGNLIFYVAKSDAFDINAQPVKVARVVMSFDPPLWQNGSTTQFNQTLDVASGSVHITTAAHSITAFIDANANALRVFGTFSKPVTATASASVYRTQIKKTSLGRGFCKDRYDTPDEVANPLPSSAPNDSVLWFHRNQLLAGNTSYWSDTLQLMGVNPSEVGPDPFVGRTFGAIMSATGMKRVNATSIQGSDLASIDFILAVATNTTQDPKAPATALISTLSSLLKEQMQIQGSDAYSKHQDWWASFWKRSYVWAAKRTGTYTDQDVLNVNQHIVFQRYLDACNGRGALSAIKFNGQAFVVDQGKGPDYRDWGACYWWQNTRQPYYNTLVSGDDDIMKPMFEFYTRMLPVSTRRVAAEFNIEGAYFPETTTQFGTYNPGDWGCSTEPSGPSTNTYIRFHTTGNLELLLMHLDHLIYTKDVNTWMKHGLPVSTAIIKYYDNRYPRNDVAGRMDMFPAQALETWQCKDPTSRTGCVTNPTTDIAGLKAFLTTGLRVLSEDLLPPDTQAEWQALLGRLPDIPVNVSSKSNQTIIMPGQQLPAGTSNSENTELYSVHPFRMYGYGKPNLTLAQQTYAERRFPCNDGWCQDVIDAAMLNLTDDAVKQVVDRANQGAADGWRFTGFAKHYQDYEPSLDHYSFMRTAVYYMLMAPVDDTDQNVYLFPSWPTDQWDISFTLKAPFGATISASCVNNTLTRLEVSPSTRRQNVMVVNCQNPHGL